MTEAEWLACKDPQKMLRWVYSWVYKGIQNTSGVYISDRKLRLWVEACRASGNVSDYFGDLSRDSSKLRVAVEYWSSRDSEQAVSLPLRADLLRDIIGNPFRPVKFSQNGKTVEQVKQQQASIYGCCRRHSDNMGCDCLALAGEVVTWLTPAVLSIAQQAYDERPGRKCSRCSGNGIVPNGTKQPGLCAACGAGRHDHCGSQVNASRTLCGCQICWGCKVCNGTGRIEDGQLDPANLSVLADALIDAGMSETWCGSCQNTGRTKHKSAPADWIESFDYTLECENCFTDKLPHPILAALRSPGPKYRGFWPIDTILGLE